MKLTKVNYFIEPSIHLNKSFDFFAYSKNRNFDLDDKKKHYLCTAFQKVLGYGVMVTLQILVLPFLVRVRVAQLKKDENGSSFSSFFVDLQTMRYLYGLFERFNNYNRRSKL